MKIISLKHQACTIAVDRKCIERCLGHCGLSLTAECVEKCYNMWETAEAPIVIDQTIHHCKLGCSLHHCAKYHSGGKNYFTMGNCSSLTGTSGECPKSIRVLTDSGAVLEFKGPKLAAEILTGFPGYGIFQQGKASLPMSDQETLISGQYYLLPLKPQPPVCENGVAGKLEAAEAEPVKKSLGALPDFVENSANGSSNLGVEVLEKAVEAEPVKKSFVAGSEVEVMEAAEAEPVKKSFCAGSDFVENLAKGSSALEVLPSGGDGVWRVKLVIDTKQLEELFSENGDAGALIETMRMAASGGAGASTPRQTKSLWGGAGGWRKPIFSNLFKVPPTDPGI